LDKLDTKYKKIFQKKLTAISDCRWTAAVNFCLGSVQAQRHRQSHWAARAEGMCLCTFNDWL